jgi:outer membrane immunogenic protein
MAATAFSVVGATSVYAADLPRKAYGPVIPAPVMTWTGFYAGLNAGYGWASVENTAGGGSSDLNGFVGGGQIGYNWQINSIVLGLEGDFQGSLQKKSDDVTILGTTFTIDQKIPWFATARARLGYAMGPWMIYATGGAAWVNYKLQVSALGAEASDNTTKTAWTVGGGFEWMFVPNWSAKLEYLYFDTGDTTATLFGTTFNARAKENLVRLGVNYHF